MISSPSPSAPAIPPSATRACPRPRPTFARAHRPTFARGHRPTVSFVWVLAVAFGCSGSTSSSSPRTTPIDASALDATSSDAIVNSGDAGKSGADGASSDATGSDGGGPTTYTLDQICDALPRITCNAIAECCTKSQIPYIEDGCLSHARSQCEANVAEVEAGTMTFDDTNVDECLATLTPYYDHCFETVDDLLSIVRDIHHCHVFTGKLPEGAACERNEQCAPATASNAWTTCDETTKTCTTTTLLPSGASCSYAAGTHSVCDRGLYCKIPATSANGDGTCVTALDHGAPCDPSSPLACGLGYYCDPATTVCTAGKPAGAVCTDFGTNSGIECQSLQCPGGTCASKTFVDAAACRGT